MEKLDEPLNLLFVTLMSTAPLFLNSNESTENCILVVDANFGRPAGKAVEADLQDNRETTGFPLHTYQYAFLHAGVFD